MASSGLYPSVNRHAREPHIQRSIRTHCGTEGQLAGAAAGPARSSRRKSTLLAVPSLLDEKEFLQQMREGPNLSPIPLLCEIQLHAFLQDEKILRTYWRLTDLENTFRQLKSELGLRPIWHSTDARISAHLFITVLAYHAVHLIRTRLRNNDIYLRRNSIRNRMASWERVTTTQQTPTGQQVVVRQDARPSDEVATIARHVNVHVGAYRQRL